MMCYKDQTFCQSDCTNEACFRFFGDTQRASAIAWWGTPEAPIAMADFSPDCPEYTPSNTTI